MKVVPISDKIIVVPGKADPREAFFSKCWTNHKTPGSVGEHRWNGWSPWTVLSHAGLMDNGLVNNSGNPSVTYSAKFDELAEYFQNPTKFGRYQIYSRLGNPACFDLESALAGAHGSGDALAFASGMAAISHTFLSLVAPGDNVVVHRNLYGCSDSLLRNFLAQLGVEVRFVDMRDPKNVEKAIDGKTRAVYLESPSNPILDLVDIRAVANLVNDRCPVIVDNTFASLVTQNPFEQGAHIVIYSLTKSIGGESEGIGGAVLGSGPFIDQLFMARKDLGAILPAREAMTFVIGLRTLKMRYEKMQQNATQLAEMLKSHPAIEDVIYPLYDERYDELCKSGQMNGPGHVLIMDLKGGVDAARKFVDNLKLGKYAVSLGSHTLLSNPWTTTHAFVDRLLMAAMGLTPGQLRISAGKEFFADIWNDFEQAFKKAA